MEGGWRGDGVSEGGRLRGKRRGEIARIHTDRGEKCNEVQKSGQR